MREPRSGSRCPSYVRVNQVVTGGRIGHFELARSSLLNWTPVTGTTSRCRTNHRRRITVSRGPRLPTCRWFVSVQRPTLGLKSDSMPIWPGWLPAGHDLLRPIRVVDDCHVLQSEKPRMTRITRMIKVNVDGLYKATCLYLLPDDSLFVSIRVIRGSNLL